MRRSVHRLVTVLILLPALLYGGLAALATGCAFAAEPAARAPHIALILPLNSPSFSRHADAVRQGFIAAAKVDGNAAPPQALRDLTESLALRSGVELAKLDRCLAVDVPAFNTLCREAGIATIVPTPRAGI